MHYSDAVAAQTLVHRGERELVFGHRARFVGVLSFGSWGAVITVPMTMLFVSGELPPAGLSRGRRGVDRARGALRRRDYVCPHEGVRAHDA